MKESKPNKKLVFTDRESLQRFANSSPYIKHLGVNVEEMAPGYVKISIKVKRFHKNTQEMVHGGVLSSLVDIAGGFAIITKLKPRRMTRTMQIDIHYLTPARGHNLRAIGQVVKMGSSFSVSDVEVRNEKDVAVTLGRCTYAILKSHN